MRRLLFSAAALVPLAAFLGCHHMAGQCDCDQTSTLACPCYGHVIGAPPVSAVPVKPVEPIKETPKPKPETPDKPESSNN